MASGEEAILLRDEACYTAHPHLASLEDGSWLLVATQGPRRAVTLHPPLDPGFVTVAIRSEDEGRTWSAPAPVPRPGLTGAECSGLTALPDGSVLLNQWRFRWYGPGERPRPEDEPYLASADSLRELLAASPELDGLPDDGIIDWTRGGGATTLWRSRDGGRTWGEPTVLDTAPYAGGYGLRGGVVLANGDVVLPLSDVPAYQRVFLVRSTDGGRSWALPEPVAAAEGLAFEEPAAIVLRDGSILMLLRENASRTLHASRSRDHGATWSAPEPAGLDGYPAHLLRLADGRLAALTAVRRPPGRVLLSVSDDEGLTWDEAIEVAGELVTHDLGYPTGAVTSDGAVFAAYYRRDPHGVTGLYGRRVDVDG